MFNDRLNYFYSRYNQQYQVYIMSIRRTIMKEKQNNISNNNLRALSGKKIKRTAQILIKNHKNGSDIQGAELSQSFNIKGKGYHQQIIDVQDLHGRVLQNDTMNFILDPTIKENLQEGATIFSRSPDHKYLLHFYIFNNKQEYEQFTDNLIYRHKIIRSCKKIRHFINPIQGIFVQKIASSLCDTCRPCLVYKVYIVQQYHPLNLENILKEEDITYCDIKNILHSFCMTMSVYQSKRLRVGFIDFSEIFITRNQKQSKLQKTVQTLAVSLAKDEEFTSNAKNKEIKYNSPDQRDSNDPQKLLNTYYCKLGDPLIKKYAFKKYINEQSQNIETDVYKNQVYQFGKTMNQYLKLKSKNHINENHEQTIKFSEIKNEEDDAKQFLQNLVEKYMICTSNNRYNWLQIQRHFQNYNNSRKIEMIPTQSKITYQPQPQSLKSSSMDKMITKDYFKKDLPYYVSGNSKIHGGHKFTSNNSINKQNTATPNTSFISLKPYQKSSSRPNITSDVHQPLTPRLQNVVMPSTLAPIQNNLSNFHYGNFNVSNQIPQTPVFNFPLSQIKTEPHKQQKNTGYGVVQNPCPEAVLNGRLQYHNLYNIGRYWTKFEGSFVEGAKQGPGTIYLSNGHIFNGFFVRDLANGKGSVYVDGELVLKGTWKNNILITQF